MKTLRLTLILTAALCAINAQAAYTYTVTSGNSSTPDIGSTSVSQGASGSTTFTFQFNGAPGDNTTTWASINTALGHPQYQQFTFDNAFFSACAIDYGNSTLLTGAGKTFTQGTTYNLVVNWTVSALAPYSTGGSMTFGFGALSPNGGGGGGNSPKWIEQSVTAFTGAEPVSVPEPAQTIAGAMLLGCGGLVFAGRRIFKKSAQ